MDLTILVPTFKRESQFKNLLEYYSKLNFKGQLLIGEGSNKTTFNKKKKFIKEFKNINVKYVYAPGLVFQTIKSIAKKVKTNYVVFSGDDDYLVTKNIDNFITFLKKNPKYSGVFGNACNIEINNKLIFGQSIYKFKKNKKTHPFKRIKIHLSTKNYTVNIFAIQKNKTFQRMLNYCVDKKSEFKCPHRAISEEMLPTSILSALGRYSYINKFYLIRTIGHERIVQKKNFNSSKGKLSVDYLYNSLTKIIKKKYHKSLKKIVHNYFLKEYGQKKNLSLKTFKNIFYYYLKIFFPKILSNIYEIKYFNNFHRNYVKKNIIVKDVDKEIELSNFFLK